ncbi:hypothetical protein B0A49_10353 [Cryomyces minteri]|uniref:Glutamyl-tRNA amidotransferase complex subunit Gta3 domain-containing protein n=1 Tax=Cryomyces minteri TaxID=331657 RepID=A0A4V5NDW2_9PEZI|nr:hypothetical protein B0A49_10353 [Cryomyces minteri]
MALRVLPKRLVYIFRRLSMLQPLYGSRPVGDRHSSSHSQFDIDELLSKPSWSVQSLLPSFDQDADRPTISSKQLHHLLRLSALPPPSSPEEEAKMLKTVGSQLHFVEEIQKIDTAGVEPLRSLRDETPEAQKEAEIGLAELKDALAQEEGLGKHHRKIRRKTTPPVDAKDAEGWDVLGSTQKKVGRYFVVESGKETE